MNHLKILLSVGSFLTVCTGMSWAEIPAGPKGFDSRVAPFFKTHCIACHNPEKRKGKFTLHDLNGDLSAGRQIPRWEAILSVIKSGEMPPEE